jgi:hypothetical protein
MRRPTAGSTVRPIAAYPASANWPCNAPACPGRTAAHPSTDPPAHPTDQRPRSRPPAPDSRIHLRPHIHRQLPRRTHRVQLRGQDQTRQMLANRHRTRRQHRIDSTAPLHGGRAVGTAGGMGRISVMRQSPATRQVRASSTSSTGCLHRQRPRHGTSAAPTPPAHHAPAAPGCTGSFRFEGHSTSGPDQQIPRHRRHRAPTRHPAPPPTRPANPAARPPPAAPPASPSPCSSSAASPAGSAASSPSAHHPRAAATHLASGIPAHRQSPQHVLLLVRLHLLSPAPPPPPDAAAP